MQALRLSVGFALCFSIPPHLHSRHNHLDCRVGVDLHLPVLPVRNHPSRVCTWFDKSSNSGHQVVHL
ncbi:hypothetical protein V6N11_053562 [Hibiscus sabdariffa]|uniref:Secreted protein n=1 Tax=Hibiscus sabdariffa TaxID=183260 RepID=A0ABR2UDG0_9ROSI